MELFNKTLPRVSADFIRQQPEYKYILSKKILDPNQSFQKTEDLKRDSKMDLTKSKEAFDWTLSEQKSKRFGHVIEEDMTSALRRPIRRQSSTTDKKLRVASNTQSESMNVIFKNDEEMGLGSKSMKKRRFSWHNVSQATMSNGKNINPKSTNTQSDSKTVLFCHKICSAHSRPKTVERTHGVSEKCSKKLYTKSENGDSHILINQGKRNKTCFSQGFTDTGVIEIMPDIQTSSTLDDRQVIGSRGVNEIVVRNSSEGSNQDIGANCAAFADTDDFHRNQEVETVVSSTNINNQGVIPSLEKGVNKDVIENNSGMGHKLSDGENIPQEYLHSSDESNRIVAEELEYGWRGNKIHFADTRIGEGKVESVHLRSCFSPPGTKRSHTAHALAHGRNSASGYDAKLEKSAVYLRSQNRTFTRASQYMSPGANGRGLSVLNVHYSQTNTGFNDRIIFADLLKAAHTTNAVIGDNVYTMERRLYNRRRDPTRCTTFYDRYDNDEKTHNKLRRAKSASGLLQKSSTGSGTKSSSARTVAGKMKARKERIQKKKERMEMGYVPRMTSLNIPNSKDIEDLLMSCRYLRIQPDKQPWLYEIEKAEDFGEMWTESQPSSRQMDQNG